MSDGTRIPFAVAIETAGQLVAALTPHVARVKVAGSLRRKKAEVGDIELVIEPRQVLVRESLFGGPGEPAYDVATIRAIARDWGRIVKGGDRYIQVADLQGIEGFKADLFMVLPPAQWGSTLAIRTGPAELGKWAVTRMLARGLRHVEGHVERRDTGEVVPTETEEQFFECAGLACVPPARRDKPEAYAPAVIGGSAA